MKTKTIFLLLLGLVPSILSVAQIGVQEEGGFVTITAESPVYYTLDGSKPTTASLLYTGSFELMYPTNLQVLNNMETFAGDATSFFHPSWIDGVVDFTSPDPANVKKETIVRACTHCGTSDEISVARSFGDYASAEGWEVRIVFDNPGQFFDVDSGIYARGVGMDLATGEFPINFGTDSFHIANFEVADMKRLFQVFDSLSYENIPEFWLGVECNVLFSYDGTVLHEVPGNIRVNGGSSKFLPLKGMKIKLDEIPGGVPFAQTGNIYLRKSTHNGISNSLANALTKSLDGVAPRIWKDFEYTHVMIDNGYNLESLGHYTVIEPNDKKFARKYLGFGSNVQKFQVVDPQYGYVIEEDLDTADIMIAARMIEDTATLFTQPYAVLDSLVDDEAWIAFTLVKSMFRGLDVWHNNMIYFAEDGARITPVLKDCDGMFQRFASLGGNTYDTYQMNFIQDFLNGNTSVNGVDRDNSPTWILRALMYHPERSNYNQNLFIDYLERFEQQRMDSLVSDLGNRQLGLHQEYHDIERINGSLDMIALQADIADKVQFVSEMKNLVLEDIIEVFHPGYDLSDRFSINVNLDDVDGSECGDAGLVKVNSMSFAESGSRTHVRDFPVTVSAMALPGFEFLYWEEFPDSAETFVLLNNTTNDMTLTPVFIQSEEVCYGQDSLVVNEIRAWSLTGEDDMVEIYNPTGSTVSLVGMCLTDDSNIPCKWTFPDDSLSKIDPYSFIVVSESELGFAFSKNGEECILSFSDGEMVSGWAYAPLPSSGVTVGLCDGIVQTMSPTIGSENDCTFIGTEEEALTDISVWPNPTTGLVNVSGYDGSIEVYDVFGKKVAQFSDRETINLEHVPSGVYTLLMGTETRKVVRR